VLFAALADTIEHDDGDLAAALRRHAARLPDDSAELAAVLVALRKLGPEARASAVRVLDELVRMTAPTRRRR
jgi:hypothetical protein